jgi:hypothetical protein
MKHFLYNNHADRGSCRGDRFTPGQTGPALSSIFDSKPRKKNKKNKVKAGRSGDQLIVFLIGQAVERNQKDSAKITEISNNVQEYAINRSIARDMGDKESEKQLTTDFINFLNSI